MKGHLTTADNILKVMKLTKLCIKTLFFIFSQALIRKYISTILYSQQNIQIA